MHATLYISDSARYAHLLTAETERVLLIYGFYITSFKPKTLKSWNKILFQTIETSNGPTIIIVEKSSTI